MKKFDGGQQKKSMMLEVKQEERTISPSLPPSFDHQDSLLAGLSDYSSSSFGHEMAIKVGYQLYMYSAVFNPLSHFSLF